MNNTLTHLIAAPVQQAPNLPGGVGGAGGTVVAGLILAVWIASKWKKELNAETRKYVMISILTTACLMYGGGVIAQMLGTAATTAGTVTGTVTGQ
jgi:cytochrome bd-type quinol oxidase subunit 2